MAVFDTPDTRFDLRTAGACLHEGRVLAQTTERMDFYVLPGGRVASGEDSRSALGREMREELGSEVHIEDLLFIVENFFTLDRMKHHEILMIYAMHPEVPRPVRPEPEPPPHPAIGSRRADLPLAPPRLSS